MTDEHDPDDFVTVDPATLVILGRRGRGVPGQMEQARRWRNRRRRRRQAVLWALAACGLLVVVLASGWRP